MKKLKESQVVQSSEPPSIFMMVSTAILIALVLVVSNNAVAIHRLEEITNIQNRLNKLNLETDGLQNESISNNKDSLLYLMKKNRGGLL